MAVGFFGISVGVFEGKLKQNERFFRNEIGFYAVVKEFSF